MVSGPGTDFTSVNSTSENKPLLGLEKSHSTKAHNVLEIVTFDTTSRKFA